MSADSYVEPCVECAFRRCNMCLARSVDHATGDNVPCPCRMAGHHESGDPL